MNPARPETTLGDLEATAFAQQQVGGWHAHVLVRDLAMAMRGIIVAKYRQWPHDGHAGGIDRHQNHRLLRMARCFRIGLAHQDEDLAAWIAGAGDPPLVAVDEVVVAITFDAGGDVGGVRRRHGRLGHGKGRADLAAQQGLEPLLLVFFGTIALDGFHVASIGGRAVEHFRRPADAAHDLAQRRVVEVRQAFRGAVRLRQEQVPQAQRAGLGLEFFNDGSGNPAVALVAAVAVNFLFVGFFVRIDMLVHELQQFSLQFLAAWRIFEFHVMSPGWMRFSRAECCCQFLSPLAYRQPISAIGRADLPDASAWALDAVPST